MSTEPPSTRTLRRQESGHTLPPLAHEVMRAFLPGLERVLAETVALVRARPGWEEHQTLHPQDLLELDPIQALLKAHAYIVYRRGLTPEQAQGDADFAGQHLYSYLPSNSTAARSSGSTAL